MGSAGAEHTADEAGGEAVFSSDGLPSLSTPLPPPVINSVASSNNVDNADAVIEESTTPAVDVFESFHAHAAAVGWSGLSKSTNDNDGDSASVEEDPRRALFRLRAEVDRLESALAAEGQTQLQTSDANEPYQLRQLKSRLENMLGGDASSNDITLDKLLRGRQEDLSRVIAKDLQKYHKGDLAGDMDKLNIDADGDDNKNKKRDGKIIYELYSSSLGQQQQQDQSSRAVTLAERLRKLETLLGSTNTTTTDTSSTTSTSLLQRLNNAERLTKEMDMKEVEKLATKAKVIRSDLEAAARARQKLASSSSSRVNDEDARTLTALHNHLVELEGISTYLPALTVRLTELSSLHSNAAEFGERLNVCEEAADRSEKMLDSVEVSLKKMKEGWSGAKMQGWSGVGGVDTDIIGGVDCMGRVVRG